MYWWAFEPTSTTLLWFKYRKATEDQNWFRRFSYWWTGIRKPKAPLTGAQTCLYFKLLNLSDYGRRITRRGLATLLGVDVKTVIQGVKKLKAENLVDDDLLPIDPTPDQVKWFQPQREKPAFRASESLGCVNDQDKEAAILSKPLIDRGGKLLTDAGFSEKHVIEYFQSVLTAGKKWVVIYSFMSKFDEFFHSIQRQHENNVAAGKYTKAKNCRGLLRSETEKRIKAMVQKYR